ncbi:MAG TPA: SurA N-terminal domain-containing protein, partial [Methyloradius sp.]
MKFSNFLSIGRVLAGSAIIALSASVMLPSAQAADAVIATVNGKPIKQSTYDFIVKDATARGQNVDDNTRNVIINKLVSSELVAQEAQRIG